MLMQDCWAEDPGARLTVDEVIARLDVAKPVDRRPVESGDMISPISFRNSVGGRLGPSEIGELEALISAGAAVNAS